MARRRSSTFEEELTERLQDAEFARLFAQEREALRLGAEIARLRKLAGLSQRDLAAIAGMRKQNVARLESQDYTSYTLKTLQRVAGALGKRLEVRFVDR